MKRWVLPLAAALLLSAGCTTQSMKGTPFYSGEYEEREGPAANRLNLWPVLYYRDPALSVLWPIMEFSPAHQAVRPIYSAYDLDTQYPVYNVVWPVARFDPGRQDYRIFPFYWGDDYFNAVPLYWHAGEPRSGAGHDALFPLWIWSNYDGSESLYLAWPLYARHRYGDSYAWRLWPLYGMKQSLSSIERSVVWPLIHTYTNDTASGHWILPLYARLKTDAYDTFLSLPYSFSQARHPGEKSWDMAIPLWRRTWEGNQLNWIVFPALSWGKESDQWSDNWYALGMGRFATSPDGLYHHVLPLYYYASDSQSRAFYTLPWWSKKGADGSGFNALVPVYYHGYSAYHSSVYSIPWLMNKRADGSGWHASFPLYYRGYSPQASSFYSLPWFSKQYADGSGWHTTIPLYYRSRSQDSSAFYCPVWMSETHPDDTSWRAAFPVYYSAVSPDGSIVVTPFYARKRHGDGALAWRCYIPFVYVNEDYDAHFMTLLGGRWRLGDRQNWMALPLLSGGGKDAESGRNIYLAGIAAQGWDEAGSSHYVIPLYYRAAQAGTFVSLPYTTWSDGERQNHLIPPLLSGWYAEDALSRGLLAAGLVGYRSGGLHPYHYVFPLYYSALQDGTLYSIPYSTWRAGDRQNHLALPLLSGWHTSDDSSGGFFALGLAGYRNGGAYSYSYLIPFYYAALEEQSFLSLPYATWNSGERQHHSIPLLLSGWSSAPQSKDVLLAGGVAYWRRGLYGVEGSHLIPFYMWAKDKYFYSAIYGTNRRMTYYATPLVGRYESGGGKSGGWVFPFYWHKRSLSSGEVKGYYFPLGYFSKTDNRYTHGFMGLYNYDHQTERGEAAGSEASAEQAVSESRELRYLFSLGERTEAWAYAENQREGPREQTAYMKKQSFFPLWHHRIDDALVFGSRHEKFSVLGIVYDMLHEKESQQDHDYMRRRVLWRLFHYEKLNGDMSTDIFPGITVDSYNNGYYKLSVLWHLFRYEKDPENGKTKLDVLFIPLKR